VAHTVTADQETTFDSGTVDPRAVWSFTFSSPGTFDYHCTFHPWMKGTVSVSP
jgi:plastocyanin